MSEFTIKLNDEKITGKEILEKLNGELKVIVPVSGGKDSQLCLKMAIEEHGSNHVIGAFCDTKWEHPLTYKHVSKMSEFYNVDIYTLNAGSVKEQVIKQNRFPVGIIRFCTDQLKIIPSKKFYSEISELKRFEVWYGMRSDESQTRNKRYSLIEPDDLFEPHEVITNYPKYLGKRGVTFRLPIVNKTEEEVFSELSGFVNPLYQLGSKRVGCFPCLLENKTTMASTFAMDDIGNQRKNEIIWLEDAIGQKHETANTSQICMFCQI